jgi:hypothetical protein
MRLLLSLFIALAAFSSFLIGQTQNPPSAAELAEIAARGRALAEYDQAAWHAGDAVEALHLVRAMVQLYVARKTPSGWTVAYGTFDPARTRFLISYEAKQGANPIEYTVVKHDPVIEDTDFYFHAASAMEVALKDFYASPHPERPYNISVLPAKTGDWYVYAIPGQQEWSILPFGGDLRYTVSGDGVKVIDRRQMHKTVLEESRPAKGSQPDFGFHSHILSDVPEDSDIFYAMTRKAQQGEWVATRKYVYEITPDFSFVYLGNTKDVAAFLSNNDCHNLATHANLCAEKSDSLRLNVISFLWRLTELLPEAWPLQPSASFENANCKDGQIWITLKLSLRNVGDSNLLLSRAYAGNVIQARFANSPADLISEKYEILGFISLDPKIDKSNDDSFAPLSPGEVIERSKEVPLISLDPKGKNVAQLLVYTWFTGDEKPPKQIVDRYAKSGTLFTDSVLTGPLPFTLDPKLVESCKK